VLRAYLEGRGERVDTTRDVNPGEVWEEDEFWIELSWAIDPDGSLGVRKWFESPYRKGEKISVVEYYRWIFENSVPGLPEAAKELGLSPLQYMRRFGAFEVKRDTWGGHEKPLPADDELAVDERTHTVTKDGVPVGVEVDGVARIGFTTPSRRLEIFSKTLVDWGWPEHATPGVIDSHIHRKRMDASKGEFCLVPTFRLPTLIHTRSGNAKWLYELSNTNPVWMHPADAAALGVALGELVRVTTRIGHFVNRVWVTEGMRPGVVACSHHLGRWRLFDQAGTDRWASAKVERQEKSDGTVLFRRIENVGPFESDDPDSKRVWWSDGGVHQNMTFPVQPDPVSGMHCWHQAVKVEKAKDGDRYGDVFVDTRKSMDVYREWLAKTRPAPGPGGLRRPLHFARAVRPAPSAYRV
jgi:anaerobic selenocysteine-containing dehydrogenase